jgi:hypothetical protein
MKTTSDQEKLQRPLILWLAFGAIVPLVFALIAWHTASPMLNPDSAMGFLAWESHAAGAPWNHIRSPDPDDISRDRDYFLTWWSPAQHDIPGIFRSLGANWGQSMTLTCLIGSWLTLWGCWQLARRTGGTHPQAVLFSVVSVCQWHTLFPFGHFRGGDVVLGAATPWLMLIAWETRHRPVAYILSIPLLILGGQYLKLSSLLLTGPLLLLGWFSNLIYLRRSPLATIVWALATPAIAALSWWTLKMTFLDRGANPGSAGLQSDNPLALLTFALGSPLLAATGAGSLIGHAYYRLGLEVDSLWRGGVAATLPGVAVGWWLSWRFVLLPLPPRHRWIAIGITGASAFMLATLLIRGAPVAVEDRFLRPASTVLLLVLSLAVTTADTKPRRRILTAIAFLIATIGLLAAVQRGYALHRNQNKGKEGILQQDLPPEALDYLAKIDADGKPRSKLIYLPHTNMAFQIRNQRVLATDDLVHERDLAWRGRVQQLVVTVPEKMQASGAGERIRSRFLDYQSNEWTVVSHGRWYFWKAGGTEN